MLVIKIGGGEGINLEAISKNLAKLQKDGEKIVVVVGGNAKLTQTQKERGITPKMITSERGEKSRYTDEATLELLKKVYGGVANEVAKIVNENGGDAIAMLASKDDLVVAKQHERMRILENEKLKVIEGDLTGRIEKVNGEKIQKILSEKKMLITTPPTSTLDGKEVNVDGDKIASKIAIELKASKLIFFSNTKGLLRDVEDEESLIKEIPIAKADEVAIGRMKKKILSAKRAIESGVKEVCFGDGRIENAIDEVMSGSGSRVF